MALRFLPGDPNKGYSTIDTREWDGIRLLAYCSGNNLIVIENETHLLQTIYLPSDGRAVAIDAVNGHIAVAYDSVVHIYKPIKSFNDPIHWELYFEVLENDFVDAISWGAGDLLVGSDRLSLWRNSTKQLLWQERMPQRIRFCTFSPDDRLICTFGLQDSLPKIWERNSFDSENITLDFDYITHPADVISATWRNSESLELNVLYTFAKDGVLRIWAPTQGGPFGLWSSIYCGEVSPAVVNNTKLPKNFLGDGHDSLTDLVLVWNANSLSAYTIDNVGGLRRDRLAKVTRMVDNAQLNISCFENLGFDTGEAQLMVIGVDIETRILVHEFNGGLYSMAIDNKQLSNAVPGKPLSATILSSFTGHQKSIQKISRSSRGDRLFSQSRFSENWVWEALPLRDGTTLITKSKVDTSQGQILWSVVRENTLLALTATELTMWDIRSYAAKPITSIKVQDAEQCLDLFLVPSNVSEERYIGVFATFIRSWLYKEGTFEDCGESTLEDLQGEIRNAASIDPVQIIETDQLENGLITITDSNWVQCWCIECHGKNILFRESSRYKLDSMDPIVRVQMSSNKKLAIAQRKRLQVFDSVHHILDMDNEVEGEEEIHDLDWTTTPTEDNLLGVGFSQKVVIYCQQRYDYSKELDAWMPIRIIDISAYTTHNIGDSIWLKDGTFVIGAGNQLFIQDCHVDMKDETMRRVLQVRNTISAVESASTIYDISAVLNGPLALYHPQLLIQAVYADRLDIVSAVLVRLLHQLKFGEVESLLGFDIMDLLSRTPLAIGEFTSDVAAELEEMLAKVSLPYLTRHQQITLLGVIQSVDMILNKLNGIDVFGIKFLLGHRMFLTHKTSQAAMTMRDFVWAWLSGSKAVLLNEVLKLETLSWELLRKVGVPYWVDHNMLMEITENLARQIYSSTRDPVLTSLYYLALRKKPVLQGLWRVAVGHPEQQKTVKLLNHDYTEPARKTTALKNAYALLSKRRYEYAAALFLLGDSVDNACGVIVRHMKDPALAVLVARVYSGDSGDGMVSLVEKHILPGSEETNDRWTATWAYHIIGQKEKAIKSSMFVDLVAEPTKVVRQMEDPVLTVLYQSICGNTPVPTRSELEFLKKAAFIYTRMGCELVAANMMGNWTFQRNTSPEPVSDEPNTITTPEPKADIKPPPPPQAMAAEPDMSAFDFGF